MITIIIYNYNSLEWLKIAVHQIRKHTKIPYKIIVSDQSEDKQPVLDELINSDIMVVGMEANRSGYAIDYILKNVEINTEYMCTMDVDTFPIHDDWLLTPIALLNEFDLTWVGLRAEFEDYYVNNFGFKLYFHMAQCFRVGRTRDFKILSEGAGFSWTKTKYDDGVMAHAWEDKNFKNRKLSLPVTGRIGLTLTEGEYGRVVGNLVLHFCLSFTSKLHENKIKNVGADYMMWEDKITNLHPDDVVAQMIDAVWFTKTLQPLQYWNGEKMVDPPTELVERVKELTHKKGNLALPLYYMIKKYNLNIRGVVHIGAHYGQEIIDYEDNDIHNVIMIEPIRASYLKLLEKMPDWVICYQMALGNKTGVATMNVETSGDGMSSSLLEPALHLEQYPTGKFDQKELVRVQLLDNVRVDKSKFNMLNIDVQGYELEVLKGAVETLKYIDVIYCEVNKAELYKGCPMVEDIDKYLLAYGFHRVEVAWIGGNWGDALYIKK